MRIQGTSVTINAANVTLDQMIFGANNASSTFSITNGQTYNMNEGVYFGQITGLTAVRTFTLNLSGGTLNAPTFSLNHANTTNAASVVNLSGGRLTATLIQRTRDGNSQAFNWTGGTIANTAGDNLTLGRAGTATQNLVLTLTGSGNQTFEAESGRSITVAGTATLAGNGTLTKTGGGNLIINSASTFTGGTTLTAGTITLGNASALSTGPVTVNAGTLDLNGLNVTLTRLSGAGGAITLGGGNLTINSTVAAATLASSISGAGSVTKTGGAVLTLAGNSTYTGDTFLQTSGIQLGVDDALPTGTVFHFTNSGASRLQLMGFDQTLGGLDSTAATGGTIVEAAPDSVNNAAATLTLDVASGSYNYTASLRDAPSSTDSALTLVKNGAGTQVLSGGVAVTYSGTTTINGGVLEFASANNVANNSAMTVNAGGTVRFSGGGTRSNTISGSSGTLEKTGANTLTLSGNNSFSGAVSVQAGVLNLNSTGGAAAAGSAASISVASDATLLISQSDQVSNTAVVSLSGGTIQRGGNVSEVFGNLNVTTTSFLDYGAGNDAGTIRFGTYTPSALLTVQNFLPGNKLQFGNTISSTDLNNATLFSFSNDFTTGTESGFFTITAIPEPSTYLAAAGLLAVLMWPSRRRLLKDAKAVFGLRAPMRDRLQRRA